VTVDEVEAVTIGVGAVVVLRVIPIQEQAEEYSAALEQYVAYAGLALGLTVIWRAAMAATSGTMGAVGAGPVTVTVTVVVSCGRVVKPVSVRVLGL
jgi:hypothetical protein